MPIVVHDHLNVFRVLPLDPRFQGWTPSNTDFVARDHLDVFRVLPLDPGFPRSGRSATPIIAHHHLDVFRVLPLDPRFQGWTPSNAVRCAGPPGCFSGFTT
jgi:hypothetical protein